MPGDYGYNFRSPKVDIHQFSMIPRAEIPRSTFKMQATHKTTIQASDLVPVFVTEVLPGDTFSINATCYARLSTPIYPIMDNMEMEFWWFFVPNRIVWQYGPGLPGSWEQFMGEQPQAPTDSISYNVPTIALTAAQANTAFTIYDYMGIPAGNITGANLTVNALPFRAYNMIWNEWYKDQNLDTSVGYGAANTVYDLGNGPDPQSNYTILQVRKRHDYFTSGLPWTQKGAAGPVTLPLGTSAVVRTAGSNLITGAQSNSIQWLSNASGAVPGANVALGTGTAGAGTTIGTAPTITSPAAFYPANLYADLSTATAATINQIRLAFQTQKLLERDARGGTRYTEIIRSHFGVMSPDARLQRPEYLGGGKTPVNISPVPQTVPTYTGGPTSPLGNLAAVGTAVKTNMGMRQSFTEHGHILGLCAVRRDPIYQQGLRRLWTRQTRYDFYFPVFAMLGEQGIRNDELYATGTATDSSVFAYIERWGEYRYFPSMVSGAFRSLYTTPLDAWHLAQKFSSAPALNTSFITDDLSTTLQRNLAAGALSAHQQFLCDFFFDIKAARPMPAYSVPGLIDHF